MINPGLSVLVECKVEYTKYLLSIMYPLVYSHFNNIYDTSQKESNDGKNNMNVLKYFQSSLSKIPKWDNDKLEEIYTDLNNKCNWVDDLITAVFISFAKVYSAIKLTEDVNKPLDLHIPKTKLFLHHVYIMIAREVWKNPYLFYHDVKFFDKQRNESEFKILVKNQIEETIRTLLPVKHILKEYINNNISDDISIEINRIHEQNLQSLVNGDLQSTSVKHEDNQSLIIFDNQNGGENLEENIDIESNSRINLHFDIDDNVLENKDEHNNSPISHKSESGPVNNTEEELEVKNVDNNENDVHGISKEQHEQPEAEPEEQLDAKPEEQPDTEPEEQPEVDVERQPDTEPEEQPEVDVERQPDTEPEEQPEVDLERQPEEEYEKPEVEAKETSENIYDMIQTVGEHKLDDILGHSDIKSENVLDLNAEPIQIEQLDNQQVKTIESTASIIEKDGDIEKMKNNIKENPKNLIYDEDDSLQNSQDTQNNIDLYQALKNRNKFLSKSLEDSIEGSISRNK